jgi:hypothetical protein
MNLYSNNDFKTKSYMNRRKKQLTKKRMISMVSSCVKRLWMMDLLKHSRILCKAIIMKISLLRKTSKFTGEISILQGKLEEVIPISNME